MNRRTFGFAVPASLIVVVLLVVLGTGTASADKPVTGPSLTDKAILFAADGMRPDLMEQYAGQGLMPTYADLMTKGVRGANGLLQAFPPNTGVGWHTLATGSWPASDRSRSRCCAIWPCPPAMTTIMGPVYHHGCGTRERGTTTSSVSTGPSRSSAG